MPLTIWKLGGKMTVLNNRKVGVPLVDKRPKPAGEIKKTGIPAATYRARPAEPRPTLPPAVCMIPSPRAPGEPVNEMPPGSVSDASAEKRFILVPKPPQALRQRRPALLQITADEKLPASEQRPSSPEFVLSPTETGEKSQEIKTHGQPPIKQKLISAPRPEKVGRFQTLRARLSNLLSSCRCSIKAFGSSFYTKVEYAAGVVISRLTLRRAQKSAEG